MRKLILLLKTRLANTYNIDKLRQVKRGKLVLYAFAALYLVFSLIITFYGYAKGAADYLNQYQLISFMLTLFFIASSFSTFMFTIYNAKSSMFNSSDNDMLLSMPIKASTILASRLIYISVWNLVTSLFVMVPAFFVYAKNVDVPFIYYPFALIVFLLLPIIPTILASIIGYVIAYLTSKSSGKNWFEIVISFLFVGIIYYGMSQIDSILNFIVNNTQGIENILKWGFYPIYLIGEIFNDYNYLSLAIYIVLNLGLFYIFTYILSFNFKNIIAKLQENKTKSNYVMKSLKTSSISKVLYIKELKRYVSSPIYVFNTFFAVIMILFAAIVSIFYDKGELLKAIGMGDASSSLFGLLVPAMIFISFISSTTSATISIEGQNYWILKTLPIHPSKIFKGKIGLNVSLILPAVFVSLIIFYFTIGLTLAELLVLLIIVTISSFVSAQFGLLVNLKFPKMDAINDIAIVKRSASVMIAVFAPMAAIFGGSAIYSALSGIISFNTFMLIVTILLFTLNFVEYYLLNTWGIKRFKEIN